MAKKGGNPQNLSKDGNPGHRGAGGRPPKWFKEQCAKIASRPESLKLVEDVLDGKPLKVTTVVMVENGKMVKREGLTTPDVKDRLAALEWVSDRGFGKPTQPISGDEDRPPAIAYLPVMGMGEAGKLVPHADSNGKKTDGV